MPSDQSGMLPSDRDEPDPDSRGRQFGTSLALAPWSILRPVPVPPSMAAELARLRAAFPAFSIGIRPGWRGPTFEAWRSLSGDGLYAVVTQDADELWHELNTSQVQHEARTGSAKSSGPEGTKEDVAASPVKEAR